MKTSPMSRWHKAQLVAVCLLCASAFAFPLPCFGMFIAPMQAYFGGSLTEVNLYFTFMTLAAVVSCFVGDRLLAWNMRATVVLSALAMVAGYGVLAAAPSVGAVWAAGVLAGLGYPLCSSVLVPVVINRWFARCQGTFVGIAFACVGVAGIALGPVITVAIGAWGWRWALAVAAGCMLAACLVAVALLRPSPVAVGECPWESPLASSTASEPDGVHLVGDQGPSRGIGAAAVPWVVTACVAGASICSGMLGDMNTQINAMAQAAGFDAVAAGLAFSGISAGLVAGKVALGWLKDRRGATGSITLGCAVGVVAFAFIGVAFLTGNTLLLVAAAALAGACTCLGTIAPALLAADAFPSQEYGRRVAHATAFCNGGMALGVPFYSLSVDMTGSPLPILVGLAVVAAVCVALTRLAVGHKGADSAAQPAPSL